MKQCEFKSCYGEIMQRVSPSASVIENVLLEQGEYEYWEADKKADREKWFLRFGTGFLRTAVMACVFCVCFVFSLQVVAGSVPQVYELLYRISPQTAQFFMPVNEVSEKHGIRMEVVSAYVHDNAAEVCITMEDLKGNRIDKSLDIGERYSIHQPFAAMGGCQLLDYDAESGVATLLITVTQMGEQDIIGKKMTFSVREFSSGMEQHWDMPVDVDLTKAEREPKLVTKWLNGFSCDEKWQESEQLNRMDWRVLVPGVGMPMELVGEEDGNVIIEGIEISGIAYTDGYLRIQTRSEEYFKYNNHAYLWLEDAKGNKKDCVAHFSYNEEEGDDYTNYVEFVTAISEEELGSYTLHANVWTYDIYEEGPWQVTFPLEQGE